MLDNRCRYGKWTRWPVWEKSCCENTPQHVEILCSSSLSDSAILSWDSFFCQCHFSDGKGRKFPGFFQWNRFARETYGMLFQIPWWADVINSGEIPFAHWRAKCCWHCVGNIIRRQKSPYWLWKGWLPRWSDRSRITPNAEQNHPAKKNLVFRGNRELRFEPDCVLFWSEWLIVMLWMHSPWLVAVWALFSGKAIHQKCRLQLAFSRLWHGIHLLACGPKQIGTVMYISPLWVDRLLQKRSIIFT